MHSYGEFTMLLFTLQQGGVVEASRSYRHSLNTNWNIIFIKPHKAFNSICKFSNVSVMIISSFNSICKFSNVSVMIISSYLNPIMRKPV